MPRHHTESPQSSQGLPSGLTPVRSSFTDVNDRLPDVIAQVEGLLNRLGAVDETLRGGPEMGTPENAETALSRKGLVNIIDDKVTTLNEKLALLDQSVTSLETLT